jgi:hypothetical protein
MDQAEADERKLALSKERTRKRERDRKRDRSRSKKASAQKEVHQDRQVVMSGVDYEKDPALPDIDEAVKVDQVRTVLVELEMELEELKKVALSLRGRPKGTVSAMRRDNSTQ